MLTWLIPDQNRQYKRLSVAKTQRKLSVCWEYRGEATIPLNHDPAHIMCCLLLLVARGGRP